jgi:hypothetical protein
MYRPKLKKVHVYKTQPDTESDEDDKNEAPKPPPPQNKRNLNNQPVFNSF